MIKTLLALVLLASVSLYAISLEGQVQTSPNNTEKLKGMVKFAFAAGHCNSILISNITNDKDQGVCVEVLMRYNAMLKGLKDV